MVKDITFLPTANSGPSASSSAASTSRVKLEDTLKDDEVDEVDEDDDDDTPMHEYGTSTETGLASRFLSCSTDKTIKLWDAQALKADAASSGNSKVAARPLHTYMGRIGFNSVSHHRKDTVFASASDRIDLWDQTRSEPLMTMAYGAVSNSRSKDKDSSIGAGDHIISVRFNQSETSVLASAGSDRTVCLYDIRSGKATTRLSMEVGRVKWSRLVSCIRVDGSLSSLQVRSNQLSWNPLQPTVLLLASEDSNLYTFDVRNFKSATQVFKGHVGA